MEKILLILGVMIFAVAVYAQNATAKPEKSKQSKEMGMKDHLCTSTCKDGKHLYAHGEKGHVCGEECKKMMAREGMMKEHVCTAACKDGKHMYAHGEKGHTCTEACKKM